MNRPLPFAFVAVLVLLGAALIAQQPQAQAPPRVGYVYPAGGRIGTTFQVTVAGQFLDGASRVIVSGSGVRGRVIAHDRPLRPAEINQLREKIQALQQQAPDPAVRREIVRLREKIADSQRRNQNPALAETLTVEVAIAADAPTAVRLLRVGTPTGLSNPLVFDIGTLVELREGDPAAVDEDGMLAVTLPAVVNGRIVPGEDEEARAAPRQPGQYRPGDVDRFRFAARTGQDLVVLVSARDLMPYLADAVPGWFQATVALFDSSGREVAFEDDYRHHPDPVLHYRVPADGAYTVEIKDALYRGREDFVYRVALGELPFVTSVFPLGGRTGSSTTVELSGWNLASTRLTVDGRGQQPGLRMVDVQSGALRSNRLPFSLDTLPEHQEHEPNDSPQRAHMLTLPATVNGRIQQPGDWDVYGFTGHAGQTIVAEVLARRLDSPLDASLELVDEAGRPVAFGDDQEDRRFGLITHHADPVVTATLAAGGRYTLRVGDVQRKGGGEYGYRLRIGPPRPDFELRIAPSAVNGRAGLPALITAHAVRRDGFAGDIALRLKTAPPGYMLSGAAIPAGQDSVRLTLSGPPFPTDEPLTVEIEGRATIGGKTVVRQAAPADEMMQAFAYKHLVPADELYVSVSGRGGPRAMLGVLDAQPIRIPAGGAAWIHVVTPPGYRTFESINFELDDPPEGISIGRVSVTPMGADLVLQSDANRTKPGQRGNLIVTVSGERATAAAAQAPPARRRVPLGVLPAIAFEIIAAR